MTLTLTLTSLVKLIVLSSGEVDEVFNGGGGKKKRSQADSDRHPEWKVESSGRSALRPPAPAAPAPSIVLRVNQVARHVPRIVR